MGRGQVLPLVPKPAVLTPRQEELMFEEMSSSSKGKGKEKDVGKRRAYVRVVTSLGGSLNLELYCEKVGNARCRSTRVDDRPGPENLLQLFNVGQSG